MAQTLLATVVSDPQPQPGQKHRSSGNFSTDSMPSGTKYVSFQVINTANPDIIHFDVMQDVSMGIDPTRYSDAYNGFQSNYTDPHRSLYIANPRNASGNFTVQVYANT
ncbi:hypothetical protein ACFSUS_21280 [Spirosoma soli]|uniref:Uncharacterized protein n=1 Tax=Spirosoma soli TaxID=1770529 RepID=A0ABW5M923_9BACT